MTVYYLTYQSARVVYFTSLVTVHTFTSLAGMPRAKATSSSKKVNHSGSKLNTAGRHVSYRESLRATAIGARKISSDHDLAARLRGT